MTYTRFITEEEVESIHQATLRILSETGITLTEQKCRDLLTAAGASVRGKRVLFPPELVEKCVARAGKRTSIRGRGGMTKTLGDGVLRFHNLGGAPNIFDPVTGTRRHTTVQDVRDSTRLLDGLENCHTIDIEIFQHIQNIHQKYNQNNFLMFLYNFLNNNIH